MLSEMTDGLPDPGGREQSLPPVSFGIMLVFCTFPDGEKAREIGGEIISQGLAACVNILPGVESIYIWKGKVQRDAEVLAIFKVRADGYGKLEHAILSKHPYDTPEIIAISADKAEAGYLDWVLKAQPGSGGREGRSVVLQNDTPSR